MRVIIDAHMIGQRETGNETYVLELLSELVNIPQLTVAAVVGSQNRASYYLASIPDLKIIHLPSDNNWLRLGYYLPKICREWYADILHVTYVAPFMGEVPIVASVHDISYRFFPEFFSARDRLLFATLLPLTLRRAKAIVTLSEFSRNEIYREYPYLDKKVHTIPLAARRIFSRLDKMHTTDALLKKFNITERFILAVGNLQPRKNLLRLIRAFASVQHELDVRLVIVGKAQWQASQIYKLVVDSHLENKVVFTGYVSDNELLHLYNAASLFIYPSLYEGFGLPILEAMACGTPVIASNSTSIPEVAKSAALLVDPLSELDIREAIVKVLRMPGLAQSLSQKGLNNAREFSWRKTAEDTAMVYNSIIH